MEMEMENENEWKMPYHDTKENYGWWVNSFLSFMSVNEVKAVYALVYLI